MVLYTATRCNGRISNSQYEDDSEERSEPAREAAEARRKGNLRRESRREKVKHLKLLVAVAVLMAALLVLIKDPAIAGSGLPEMLELPSWDALLGTS
jgi:hypothetical protein